VTPREIRTATVFTHRAPDETRDVLERMIESARQAGVTLRFDPDETAKHGLSAGEGVLVDAPVDPSVDVCVVLGGDGTILRGLRSYLHTGVPVFAVNFGQIGFLATIDPDECDPHLDRAFTGDFEVVELPGVTVTGTDGAHTAINDVAVHRKPGHRVAELSWDIAGQPVGHVRCDGLVVSTPTGSTGYNLANGGPVMAWGVEGFAVSYIAPHSLAARVLVIAPDDVLTVHNTSHLEAVDVSVDGRPVGEIEPDGSIDVAFVHNVGALAQLPGSSFYQRLREKFRKLAA
jgi:NAD+ kinase